MLGRRDLALAAGLASSLVLAAVLLASGLHRSRAPEPAHELATRQAALRQALQRYRDDHGWYPGDPNKDYNSDGRADLLVRQLTWFTRDDGKPADRRDADFCFGPYLMDFPADPVSGSQALVVDQDQARAFSRLRDDVARGAGRGGWYYEALTGNIVPNLGLPARTHEARF